MEKIKNLLRPGNQVDDEALYGQQEGGLTKSDARHTGGGLSGEGSHFAGARETNLPGQTHGSQDPALTGKGDGLSQPGRQTYPVNSGVDSSNNQSTSTTSGPHRSDLVNKADPRVDSDNSRFAGNDTLGSTAPGGGNSAEHREYDPQGTASTRGVTNIGGNQREDYNTTQKTTTVGPHSSDIANKADPRVDSDNSKAGDSGVSGTVGGYSSTSGGSYHTGPTGSAVGGPHQTSTANKLDPNVNTGSAEREDAIHHHEQRGGGAEEADTHHGGSGKAAGAGAVGLGALGLGSQANKSRFTDQEVSQTSRDGQTIDYSGTQSMPGTYPDSSAASTTGAQATDQTSTTVIPDRTRGINEPTSTTGEKEHQYGRDAAIAGGTAGLAGGAYGASQHSDNQTTAGPHASNTANRADPRVDSDLSGETYGTNPQERSHGLMTGAATGHQTRGGTTTAGPHSSDLANRADPRVDSDRSKETHHSRDAALGAGVGAGATAAAYGATRQHDNKPLAPTTTTSPHSSDLANRADPRVDSDRSKETHHSRDAALGAGAGAGVAGTAYSATKQPDSQPLGTSAITSGPHSSDLANRADPRVDSDRSKETHHSRDAALGAGVGAGAAATAHNATRQHNSQPIGTSTTTTTTTNTSTTTAGPHESNLANKLDPRVDSDRSKEKEKEKDHNHSRDAAVVGGAGATGAAAYGAHKYTERDDKESKMAEKTHEKQAHDAEKQRLHAEKEHEKQLRDNEKRDAKSEKHAEKHEKKEQEKKEQEKKEQEKKEQEKKEQEKKEHEKKEHKGFLSFLHRDKNKKYSKEEEEDFDRQEREHSSRNAGTAAGVGAGTYAAHQAHDDNNPHGKGHTPLAEHPVGSTIGDKLHGTERNRGVAGSTGFPHGGDPSAGDHNTDRDGNSVGGTGSKDHTHDTSRAAAIGESGHHGTAEHSHAGATHQHTSGRRPSPSDHATDQDNNPIVPSGQFTTSSTAPKSALGSETTLRAEDNQFSGTAGQANQTGGLGQSSGGRNRLHKDPPPGHVGGFGTG